MKKTLIIGASTNPARYAHSAALRLKRHGHDIVQLGLRQGEVAGEPIYTEKEEFEAVDTVTLYVGPRHQPEYYSYVISLKPKRVIFNPGTENTAFSELLVKNNIEPVRACTLVMLSTGQY
ncbi:CoA-binding protein [Persicitalea sp.]|uniref:CoA-binding protein n=1 Tax=Persicitalea sp. TaxID=3100273 RepID=UPI0035944390